MIDWPTLQQWEGDWLEVSRQAIRRRRDFLRRMLHRDKWLLTLSIEKVRTGRRELVSEFAYGFKDQLDPDSSVATTYDLDRLLVLAQMREPGRDPEPHRWFDALSIFDQTVAVAMLEREDPTEAVGRDLDALITFLGRRVFAGGLVAEEFFVYHDPQHDYTVGSEDVGVGRHLSHRAEGRTRRLNRLTCRRTRDGKLVFLSHRDKSAYNVWLKIQRQALQQKLVDPYAIHDRCGLMFVVEREEDIAALARHIERQIVRDGGHVVESLDGNHGKDGVVVDLKNDVSSSSYKVAKMIVVWRGRKFELQFTTFADHFNARDSLTDANHALYKLRQARKYAFPQLWPEQVYGIKWDSGHVGKQMNAWMTSRLGWRVNGHHSIETP